jgi:short-subunit dehydrogenase
VAFSILNRVVVLTGASSGIGAALADVLSARGAILALVDINRNGLEMVADRLKERGAKIRTYAVDVADRVEVTDLPQRVASDLGSAAVLINNAGVALSGRFDQVTEKQFDRVMQINFSGTVDMTRAFLPQLQANQPSQLVNLSSIFGIVGAPGNVAYASSKFAVRGFSEALRIELSGSDVGITVVHPGGVRTNIARDAEVGPRVRPESVDLMRKKADKFLRMPPEAVAEQIVRGIVRRQKRILIGTDARLLSGLQRLLPVSYGAIFPKD